MEEDEGLQHWILRQFQGALLGVAIGEAVGGKMVTPREANFYQVSQWLQGLHDADEPEMALPLTTAIAQLNERVIDWVETDQTPAEMTRDLLQSAMNVNLPQDDTAIAISMLPLWLVFHDDDLTRTQLQQVIMTAPGLTPSGRMIVELTRRAVYYVLQSDGTLVDLMAAIAADFAALSQTQTQTVQPLRNLAMDSEEAQADESAYIALDPSLRQILMTIMTDLSGRTMSLSRAAAKLAELPAAWQPFIAALYCVRSAPIDAAPSLVRARQLSIAPEVTCSLTGLLLGLHNRALTFPVAAAAAAAEFVTPSRDSLKVQGTILWAVWAGAYRPRLWVADQVNSAAIAPDR
jgi:hypothetical protein